MNKEYAGNETNKVKKLNWLVNDKCAAFIHKFGNWYRGKILKVDAENKNVSVSSPYLFSRIIRIRFCLYSKSILKKKK